MTIREKCISLFLMDGAVNGRIKCTLANWTGVAYKIPRTEMDKCKTREDLKQSGVYFLFGKLDPNEEDVVYIGKAGVRKNGEGVLARLYEHKGNPQKNYWNEAVVFTTSNNSFGETEIGYLEHCFAKLAIAAGRYKVANQCEPTRGNTSEEKESELKEFIDYALMIMGILGHKVFISQDDVPVAVSHAPAAVSSEPVLRLATAKADATGKRTSDGFVVFKGSKLAPAPTPSCPDIMEALRKKHAGRIDGNCFLLEDTLFSSPSAAAGFVTYASANGRTMWQTEDGRTLKDLEGDDLI